MPSLTLMSVLGKTQVHFQCGNFGAKSITLTRQFNVLLFHSSCYVTMRLPNSRQFELQPKSLDQTDHLHKMELLLILQYDLPQLSLFSDQVQVWVTSLLVLSIGLVVIVGLSWAFFWKFRKSMTLRIDNAIYDLEKSDNTHVVFKDNVTTLQECDCGAADLVDPGPAMEEIRSALKDIEMIGPGRLPSSLDLSPTTASFVRRSSAASDTNHIYATVSHTIRKPRMTTAVSGAPPAKPAKH